MPLDFPNSPNVNDTYTSGGSTWLWDGTAWVRQVPGVLDNLTDVTLTSSANGDVLVYNGSVWANTKTLTGTTISLGNNTVSGTLAQFNTAVTDADLVSLAGTETLTNKTLTSPVLNQPVLVGPEERVNFFGPINGGTINVDTLNATFWFATANTNANWTINFRGTLIDTLNSVLATFDSVTVAFAATQGATAYRPTAFQIDGVSVTPKWQGGTAPSAGNANSIDMYVFTIVKTAATPTYTVFASQTKFA